MKQKISISFVIIVLLCLLHGSVAQQDDFEMNENTYQQQDRYAQQQGQQNEQRQPSQQEMQYFSQRRTACLVLSRYFTNQHSESINEIVKDLEMSDKNKFINKLYSTAVQKCQPLITEMDVMQVFISQTKFFTANNDQFDPSQMFHIFDGYNFYDLTNDLELTPNQKAITKFIKDFDAQMEVRKQEQQAQKINEQRDDGLQVFFISVANLPPQIKYLYIVIVLLICGGILWYGFKQIGQKPVKKEKKKSKKL